MHACMSCVYVLICVCYVHVCGRLALTQICMHARTHVRMYVCMHVIYAMHVMLCYVMLRYVHYYVFGRLAHQRNRCQNEKQKTSGVAVIFRSGAVKTKNGLLYLYVVFSKLYYKNRA